MKVIDKRNKIANEDWNEGDVICMWNNPDEKYYAMICGSVMGYALVVLNDSDSADVTTNGDEILDGDDATEWNDNIDCLQRETKRYWNHAEKVNAELVITDKED